MKFTHNLIIASLVFLVSVALCAEQKPLVIVIPSYNNSDWYRKNLDSVFAQEYDNYRIIYIDDCSIDGTYELVRDYIVEHGQEERVTLIKNDTRKGALANHYRAAHLCENYEIIVNLDGDDWFAHEHVLTRINCAYQNPDVWLTYGQYETDPVDKPGVCRAMPAMVVRNNAYREYEWITSAVRTFYAGLFKQIRLDELLYEGQFYKTTGDMAFMFPMLEMSAGKIEFIPDILYIYNCNTPENDFKKRVLAQLHLNNVIRAQKKRESLTSTPYAMQKSALKKSQKVLVLVVSENNPVGLQRLLDSIQEFLIGDYQVSVIYNRHDEQIKPEIMRVLSDLPADYVLCSDDRRYLVHQVNLANCVQTLEKTGAHGVFLGLGRDSMSNSVLIDEQQVPVLIDMGNSLCAWQFCMGEYAWRKPYSFCMNLYRVADVMKSLERLNFHTIAELNASWSDGIFDLKRVGICYENVAARE